MSDPKEFGHSDCKREGDHGHAPNPDDEKDRREMAMIAEGICPTCEVRSDRTDDGFAHCPCCNVDWAVRGHHVLIRFDASAFLAATS